MTHVDWTIGGTRYRCEIQPGVCPRCLRGVIVRLPPPLRSEQLDGTTHVCHPSFGGCNHGFAIMADDADSTIRSVLP